jgi:hypothetical protein
MQITLRARRTVWAIVAADLIAAVVEMIFVLSIQYELGAGPIVVFQSIASGLLGKVSYEQGFAVHILAFGLPISVMTSVILLPLSES